MTVVERKAGVLDRGAAFHVRHLRDRDEIRRLLEARRPYAAYALGQLDPLLFRLTEWWHARGPQGQALVLHSRGGLGNATFTMGNAAALDAALRLHPGPRHTFLTCEVPNIDVVQLHMALEQRQTMIRMEVRADGFRPSQGDVRRLGGRDARELNQLYRMDGVPSFFSSRQIDDAVYFGIERHGAIVAVAGTHVISSASEIAVVGNVYTHPRHRGQGLARLTTSAVTELLLRSCRQVVLSVDPANISAVRAYERLGYTEVARLIEGAATRRDVSGLASSVRRILAHLQRRRDESSPMPQSGK